MARQLRQQFTQRALMVSAISHDLRTPLTRLRMRLETLGLTGDPLEKSVTDIREINALIDTVLEVFRGDSGAAEPAQACDVAALLQSLCDDLAEQGLKVTCAAGGEALIRSIRPQALRRVLGNLIGNALRCAMRAVPRWACSASRVASASSSPSKTAGRAFRSTSWSRCSSPSTAWRLHATGIPAAWAWGSTSPGT
ncbi:histidine kinase dimerization/phospho-acceptor domain-containing protein [Pelomonas sp. SE-A7]|nr:histidine kinase dimerization/phospho-acceptor domain-containing protein [Pelomonas sp. SE-A7]MDM4766621.1 histidine kinase dimerization/phospho-acceptor domain-containing protein [Pelomonas sp. SE-A7]